MQKVKNAVILAAGRGSRLKHLTSSMPKPLLAPRGVRFIDGIIKNLKEKGITEIYVVTGYLQSEFSYLKDQGINLIHNKDWEKGNNVTSIKAAINVLGNSLIVNGDVIMKENLFKNEYETSLTYVEKNKYIDEWITVLNEDGNVIDFEKNGINKIGLYQREIIFITNDLANEIKKDIKDFDMQEYQEYLMIESALKNKIDFKTFEIEKELIFDLDTVEEFDEYMKSK